VGADRVVIGTDFPMALGDFVPVKKVMQPQSGDAERAAILGGNAARTLRL
jgi:predicted TIM-barrel fold metal-dependent hydrolase